MSLVSKIILVVISTGFLMSCERSNPVEITDDGLPPSPPAGISIYYALDGEIGIEWVRPAEDGIAGFYIYRAVSNIDSLKKYSYTTQDYFFDDSLEYDSTYYYAVTSVDVYNLESEFTTILNATPNNYYKPLTAKDIRINARNRENKLSIWLEWRPSNESDIRGYNIYRDTLENFQPDSANLIAFTSESNFLDTLELKILTRYFYKIITADKGNLYSSQSNEISDIILDRPQLIFPSDRSDINYPFSFQFKSASYPAGYKIVIQSNELYGVLFDYYIDIDRTGEIITIDIPDFAYLEYQTYYWRVYSFTEDSNNPNSYSELYSYKIIPKIE